MTNNNSNQEAINDFLLQISDDILFINIDEQINNTVNTSENYFSFIIDKLEGLKTLLNKDDQELIDRVDTLKDQICQQVQALLEDKFKFNCDFKCYSDSSKCLKELYKFFIIRKKEILLSLVNNYIEREYKSLLLKYSKTKINKKDVSYLNNKKSIEKEDLTILLNLHNIISAIELTDVDDLLELLIDDKDEFTYNFIFTMFQQEEIVFTRDFIDVIKEELEKEKNYLIMESRLKLMSKIKKIN